jgi:hypothetical protein
MERSGMSRSKMKRITIKWSETTARYKGGQKETVWRQGKENGRILLLRKSILLFFARAGFTKDYLFFFISNRV